MSNDSIHPSSGKFRINAKSFFLTYPQCNESKEALKDFLCSIRPVEYLLVGQETHEDGGLHLHCLVTFKKKLNVKSESFFDLNNFHPNIQAPRNIPATKNYIRKEDESPLEISSITDQMEDEDLYQLARSTGEETFFETCRKKKVTIH